MRYNAETCSTRPGTGGSTKVRNGLYQRFRENDSRGEAPSGCSPFLFVRGIGLVTTGNHGERRHARKSTNLSVPSVNAQLPLDVAHTEQQNYLNDQLQIMTEEAQRKRLEEEEVLSRLRQTRERLEGTLLFKLGWVRKNCRPKPNTQGVTQVTGDAKNVFRKKI